MKHVVKRCEHGHHWVPWGGWPPSNTAPRIYLTYRYCAAKRVMQWREALDYAQLVRA